MSKRVPAIYRATSIAKRALSGAQAIRPLKGRPHVVTGFTQYSPYDPYRQKRPPTSVDLILSWRQFVFWCVNRTASAVAAVPLRLYATQKRGEKAGRFKSKALSRASHENLGSNPVVLKRIAGAAKVEEVTEHPFLDLLHTVNPWMTTYSLFELMGIYLETVGASYWTFVRGFGGIPIEIWPLPSWLVYVEPDYQSNKVVNRYIFTGGGGQTIFEPSEVLYMRRTSAFDPYTQAWSPLRACYEMTSFFDKLVEYDESRLSNLSRPDAVLEATDEGPIGWEETQRINNDFRQNFAMANVGGLWVAPGGTTLKPIDWPGFDPVVGDRARQTRLDIARCFDIPPAMVDSTGTSRANLDATLLEFARQAVQPRCRRIEEEFNSNLLPLYDERLFVSFDTAVPADQVLQRETHVAYISAGVMSRNEARLELGLAPVDGGDELLVSNSLVPLSRAIDPPAPVIPGRVQGAEPDEVPTAATTPQSSEREEPADEADDGEFAEGEDLEASTDEPAEKAFDPDAATAIPDVAVVKALRLIDLIHERLAAEGDEPDVVAKDNPCHDADGQFCSHGGGGAGRNLPAHLEGHLAAGGSISIGGEHFDQARLAGLGSRVREMGRSRGQEWSLSVDAPRNATEARASAKAEGKDRFLVVRNERALVSRETSGDSTTYGAGGEPVAHVAPNVGGGWTTRKIDPGDRAGHADYEHATERAAHRDAREWADYRAGQGDTLGKTTHTPKDIDAFFGQEHSETHGGPTPSGQPTYRVAYRLIVPEREDGHRPFPPVIGKSNPCHGAHDGRFCHTPGGGGGAPAHAPAGALGVDVASGAEHGVTKLRRQVADRAEATIAAALGGHRLKDYEAMDVRIPKADGSGHHVIEVKTMQHGSKTGISVHENAWVRKIDHARANPGDTFHTVVIDLRHSTEGGAHAGKYSGHELYYKRTSGPFGLASMHQVADLAELGRLVAAPAAKLPAAARGQFPRGAELRALRERAAKERAYNNERSRERKRRLGAAAYGRTARDQGSNATASSG